MASIDAAEASAERFRHSVRNVGLCLLVVAAFVDSVEDVVLGWRLRVASWERSALRRVDSPSAGVAVVAIALLESVSTEVRR